MRASPYPTLECQPEKRQVWNVALPDGQSCRFAKMWGSSDPEVWYYFGGARPLSPGEDLELVRACGYADRVVTRTEDLGGVVRIETRPPARRADEPPLPLIPFTVPFGADSDGDDETFVMPRPDDV